MRERVGPGLCARHRRLDPRDQQRRTGVSTAAAARSALATLLGTRTAPIRCPRVLRVGLDFGDARPAGPSSRDLLAAAGSTKAEAARARCASRRRHLPAGCRAHAGAVQWHRRRRRAAVPGAGARPVHARGATTRRGRCSGRAPASRAGSSSSADGVLRMNAAEFRNLYRELIDENPFAIRAVLKILASRVHRLGPDAGGHLRGAAAPAREPRLRPRALPHRRGSEGRHLPRVPARAAAAHRAPHGAHAAAAPRARRGDQRDHPPGAGGGIPGPP